MFRIRVDIVSGLDVDGLIQVCDTTSHVVVRHELPHGNPHYHLWVESNIKENTLRQRIRRTVTNLKSTDMSLKKCDSNRVDEYVQYMFNTKKGNKWELYDAKNFDTELLKRLQQQAKAVADEFELNKSERACGKTNSNKITIWELSEEVDGIVDQSIKDIHLGKFPQYWSSDEYRYDQQTRIRAYTDAAIQTLRKHRKAFDEFLLRKVISTAMSSHHDGREMLHQKMLNNFLRI